MVLICLYTGSDIEIGKLMDIVTSIIDDESSVAVRLALTAMQTCLNPLLHGLHSPLGLQCLMKLLHVQANPYWLVKVKAYDSSYKLINTVCTNLGETHEFFS